MLDFDPRDRDADVRDVEMPWVELGRAPGLDRDYDDLRDRDDVRGRDRDGRDPAVDPRDVFLDGLELPRGLEREIVMDGDHRYELNGDDSRTLATVGAFRVVAERDLDDRRDESGDARDPDLRRLRDQGLAQFVSLQGRERAITLTERGHHVLETHRRDRHPERQQAFDAGVSRPRELSHDVQLYRAYLCQRSSETASIWTVVESHPPLRGGQRRALQALGGGRDHPDARRAAAAERPPRNQWIAVG